MRSIAAAPLMVGADAGNGCDMNPPQITNDDMFRRKGKTSMFKSGDSFSESALSSFFDEDTGTIDASYFSSDGSTTFWTDGTGGDTTTGTEGSYWTGGDYTSDSSTRHHQSSFFGNGFFGGPRPRPTNASNSKSSEKQIPSDQGCINFLWESSSDEDERPNNFQMLQSRGKPQRRESNVYPAANPESRDESMDILQEAFSFVSNNQANDAQNDKVPTSMNATPKKRGQSRDELDATLYSLLLGTGSNLLGIDQSGSVNSGDRSRSRGRSGVQQGSIKSSATSANLNLKNKPARNFMAPWNRQRRRQEVHREEKRDAAPSEQNSKYQRNAETKSANPFSGLRKKKFIPSVARTGGSEPIKPPRQTTTDKRLNDAIMVFAAEERPLPSTLPRSQSSKFVPSKELKRQMERNLDRESLISHNDLPTPEVLKQLPNFSRKSRSKTQPSSPETHPLERQSSRRSNRSIAKSSNRSIKSKGNRSQLTRRSSKTTRSRKSQLKIPSNQLSYSDDDGHDFFSVGSLDA